MGRSRAIRNVLLWCGLAIALCGGDCRAPGTSGANGRFDFRVLDSSGGDGPIVPLVIGGAHMTITAEPMASGCGGGTYTVAQVASSNPSVAAVTLTATSNVVTSMDVVPGAAGSTDLQLLDDRGGVIDRITLEVEPVAALELSNAGPVQVIAGATYEVLVTMKDATGRVLGGGGGLIQPTTTGAVTATVLDSPSGALLEITPTAAGAGTVVASAGGATATLQLQTIPTSAVTSVSLATGNYAPSYNANDQTAVVWSIAATAAGQVYGVPCAWQIGDPSVKLSSDGAEHDLGQPPFANNQFQLTQPGSFSAICTIGSAQLTVMLQR